MPLLNSRLVRLASFAGVGAINTIAGAATIALATLSGINPFIANVMGYAIGLAIGLSLNSRITFNKRKASLVRYLLAFAGAFALNLATVYVAIHAMGVPEVIGSLAGMPIYTIAFFLLCEHWVFRKVAA